MPSRGQAESLGVARSNVSNSLKELQSWNLIRSTHLMGDRRDHFESMADVWEMFRVVVDERKKRELDPTLAVLRECIAEAHDDVTVLFVDIPNYAGVAERLSPAVTKPCRLRRPCASGEVRRTERRCTRTASW